VSDYLKKRQDHINAGRPLPPKKTYKIPSKSEKRIEKEKAEKEERGENDSELVKFFKAAMKRMRGVCEETGLKTETKIYAYAIRSICHILSQQHCPSVKYDLFNWMEFDPGFHVKFDAMSWEEREQMGCWPVIRDKLIMVYNNLDPTEIRHFPTNVLNYMIKMDAKNSIG
jgi:hypothetical protein